MAMQVAPALSHIPAAARHGPEHPVALGRLSAHLGAPGPSAASGGRSSCGLAVLTALSSRQAAQRRTAKRRRSALQSGESPAPPQNLYQLLGLSAIEAASASVDLLKQRQRALLRVCHPDVAGDGGSAVTSLLSEAVGLLSTSQGRIEYEALLQGESVRNVYGPKMKWPSMADVTFANDEWANVEEEERGEKHAAQECVVVDEVACVSCNICVDAAPNTFDIVEYPGGDDNCSGGRTARVLTQWGDGEEALLEAVKYCPRSCIYWVPREAVRTIEYVSQAEEYQPFLGSKRQSLDVRGGKTNFDPIWGSQVWWPVEEGLRLFENGSICPEDPAAAAGALGVDERVAAAWEELPTEARAKVLDVLATASQE